MEIDLDLGSGVQASQIAVSTYETDPQGLFTPRLSTHAAELADIELAACNTLAAKWLRKAAAPALTYGAVRSSQLALLEAFDK